MNIGFVTDEFVTEGKKDGGLANYLLRVSLFLKKIGHNPIIITKSHRNEVLFYKEIEIHRVKVSFFSKLRFLFIYASKNEELSYELNKYLKAINSIKKFDIVQYTNCSAVGLYAPKDIPSVIRISSYRELWFYAYNRKINYFLKRLINTEKKAILKVSSVFCPSKILAEIIQKDLTINVKVIETPFFKEISKEDKTIVDIFKNKKFFLFFGRLGLMKGVKLIADVLPRFLSDNPEYNFVFVGKEAGYNVFNPKQYILNKTKKYKNRVFIYNIIQHEQLYPLIKKAEAVVLPSRIDNFSNACIEAMAHKKIVIGTNGASFEQLIDNGKSGFLIEIDNHKQLIDTMNKITLLTSKEKENIGQNAHKRILELHPDIKINELLKYYAKVIKEFQLDNNKRN
jgi:glycogen synthase